MMRSIGDVCREVDAFFMGESAVHMAMRNIARALTEMGIPFLIAGALATNVHGHRRTTADVDVLLHRESLRRFKERWRGRGWVDVFQGSKGMRDVEHGVKIHVLLAGDYPGDGKPKPVAFPDPAAVQAVESEGIPFLPLPTLLELKIASGMTAPHRPQDLYDAIQLIRVNRLRPRTLRGSTRTFARSSPSSGSSRRSRKTTDLAASPSARRSTRPGTGGVPLESPPHPRSSRDERGPIERESA